MWYIISNEITYHRKTSQALPNCRILVTIFLFERRFPTDRIEVILFQVPNGIKQSVKKD